jgi:hypothetical protein
MSSAELPSLPEINLLRAQLDAKENVLLLDFRAFVPGRVQIPPFAIGGIPFDTLEVNISSILQNDEDRGILSPAAGLLAAPGSIWIIVGIFAAFIALVLLIITCGAGKGAIPRHLFAKIRQAYLLNSMRRIFKTLRQKLRTEGVQERRILDWLTSELRGFISLYTGIDCRSFVPHEFLPDRQLYDFFNRCDTLRFGRAAISADSVSRLIDDAEHAVEDIAARLHNGRQKGASTAAPAKAAASEKRKSLAHGN